MSYQDDVNDINQQGDVLRKKAMGQEAANFQGAKDALARRAAQLGGGPSGAFIKQEQLAGDQSAQRLASANEGINAQVGQQTMQARQAEDARKFQTSEREASQGFSSQQAEKAFGHQKELQDASQSFTAGQNDLSRGLQASQFKDQMDRDLTKFQHETQVDDFNMKLADKMSNQKDMLEKLFDQSAVGRIGKALGGNSLGKAIATSGMSIPLDMGTKILGGGGGSWL